MNTFASLHTLAHHAYCLVGARIEHVLHSLEHTHNIQTKANPDFFHEKYETLTIDESRKIKEIHSSKSFSQDSKRIFIIECKSMTGESQNALLKIFEEPNKDSHFLLVVPSTGFLLPTLRSRLLVIEEEKDEENSAFAEAKKFLKLSLKEKITFVDDMAKKISDEEIGKSYAIEFLGNLETILYKNGTEKNIKAIKAILKARDYMQDRSPSIKQLLEFVALSC